MAITNDKAKAIAETLGANLKKIRTLKGCTRQELAAALGLDVSQIALYEKGNSLPPLDRVFALADFLGVSIIDLTGKNDAADTTTGTEVFEILYDNAFTIAQIAGLNPQAKNGGVVIDIAYMDFQHEKAEGGISYNERKPNKFVFPNRAAFMYGISAAIAYSVTSDETFCKTVHKFWGDKETSN